MKTHINNVFNLVEDWNSSDIERLISELQILANDKYTKETEETPENKFLAEEQMREERLTKDEHFTF